MNLMTLISFWQISWIREVPGSLMADYHAEQYCYVGVWVSEDIVNEAIPRGLFNVFQDYTHLNYTWALTNYPQYTRISHHPVTSD